MFRERYLKNRLARCNWLPARACVQRGFSAQAQTLDEPLEGLKVQQPRKVDPQSHVSQLGNGFTVASVDTGNPVAEVRLVLNAGTRDESGATIGAVANLRVAAWESTRKHSSLAISRSLQVLGADVTSTSTRERLAWGAFLQHQHIDKLVGILGETFACPALHEWEVTSMRSFVELELAQASQDHPYMALENLHRGAFRGGLGQSLLPPAHKLRSLSMDALQSFAQTHFTPANAMLVGVGVEHARLKDLAEAAFGSVATGHAVKRVPDVYYGGLETRQDADTDASHVMLGFEGAAVSGKNALALLVVQQALGSGAATKWGRDSSLLPAAAAKATSEPFHLSTLTANYAETGIFAIYAAAHHSHIAKVVSAATKALATAAKGLSDKDIARAKALAKANILFASEQRISMAEDMANQVLGSGKYVSPSEMAKEIDALSSIDINKAAVGLLGSKATMSAIGDLSGTPYLSDLL